MKKSIVSMCLLVVLALAFSGAVGAAEYKWPKALKIATPALGSNSYNISLAWGNKLDEMTGMKVRLLPEDSTSAKWTNLKAKKFDIMQDTMGYISNWMVEGRAGFANPNAGPFPVRYLWQNDSMTFCLFVRGDSPVKELYDIPKQGKNFRMVHWTVPGGLEILQATLAWVNLTTDDITLVQTNSYPGSVRMVAEGKADFAPFGIPPASVFIEAAANPHGLHIVDLTPETDPEGAKRFRKYLPAYTFSKTVAGPKEFQGKTGWGTVGGMICHADMDADVAYNLVKWTVENFDQIKDLHPFIKFFMNLQANKRTIDTMYLPIHEGVVRYLKEKDMWTEANEARQQYNLKLQQKYIDGFKDCMKQAAAKKIKVDANEEAWLNFWETYKKEKGIPRIEVLTDEEIAVRLKDM